MDQAYNAAQAHTKHICFIQNTNMQPLLPVSSPPTPLMCLKKKGETLRAEVKQPFTVRTLDNTKLHMGDPDLSPHLCVIVTMNGFKEDVCF